MGGGGRIRGKREEGEKERKEAFRFYNGWRGLFRCLPHTQEHTYMHTDTHLPFAKNLKHSLVPKGTAFSNLCRPLRSETFPIRDERGLW